MKWFGFRFPPRDWWLGKPEGSWWLNHPLSHLVPGLLLVGPLIHYVFADVLDVWQRLLVVLAIAAFYEHGQIEYTPPYPFYSALGDTVFVLLGAALFEGFWALVGVSP